MKSNFSKWQKSLIYTVYSAFVEMCNYRNMV